MAPNQPLRLIVGLGNVGAAYEGTRHNAGFLFIDELLRTFPSTYPRTEKKFFGEVATAKVAGTDLLLLKPTTLMNLSGKAVAAMAVFYKIKPEEILVVHDELDLPPGALRLKLGGGSAGHNGLKSITASFGSPNYARLRVGIGHPRDKQLTCQVADYVLSRPSSEDRDKIEEAIQRALKALPEIASNHLEQAKRMLGGP